jgi:hypothetical protein
LGVVSSGRPQPPVEPEPARWREILRPQHPGWTLLDDPRKWPDLMPTSRREVLDALRRLAKGAA